MSSQRTSTSGCLRLEALLHQGQQVAPVRRVDDQRRAAVAAARGERATARARRSRDRSRLHGIAGRSVPQRLPSERQQVGEQPVGPGHPGRELAEEGEAGVDVDPLAYPGHQQAPLEVGGVRVLHREQRRVGRVPGVGEVEPPLLDPALPVRRADLVGGVEDRARRDRGGVTAAVSSVTRSCRAAVDLAGSRGANLPSK